MDKAGAYAIQGLASRWIPRIEGDYFNVVGLPVALVWQNATEVWAGKPEEMTEELRRTNDRRTARAAPSSSSPSPGPRPFTAP